MNLFLVFFIVYFIITILFLKNRISKSNNSIDLGFVEKILIDDPNFNVDLFREQAKECIEEVCISYAKGNINKLMGLESTELFNIHKSQIEFGISNGSYETLFFKKFNKVNIVDYRVENNYSIIACKIWVSTRRVRVSGSTFEVLSYDEASTLHPMYFEFVRSINVKSNNECDFAIKNCPNCGAIIEINAQGKCIYCNSMLLNGTHSWVLNRIDDLYYNK